MTIKISRMTRPECLEERKCIYCGKAFYVSKRKTRGQRGTKVRSRNSKTCSKDCSKNYSRGIKLIESKGGKS